MTQGYNQRQLTFADEDNNKQTITVTVLETFDTSTSYGLYLWPCSPVLAQYIWFHRNEFLGKTILELGAGTSLPGLVAAKVGAQRVILCDYPKVEKWFSFIRETVASNPMIADRIRIEPLDWYDERSIEQLVERLSPFNVDVLLGSDIFFQKKDFETILALLERLFTVGRATLKFLGTIERRSRSTMLKLTHLVRRWNMQIDMVPLSYFHGETICPNIVAGHDIVLFSIVQHSL